MSRLPNGDLRGFWRDANRTSFGRLMVAGICDFGALVSLVALAHLAFVGFVGTALLVPAGYTATRRWWRERPAWSQRERVATDPFTKFALAVLLFLVGALALFGAAALIAWASNL